MNVTEITEIVGDFPDTLQYLPDWLWEYVGILDEVIRDVFTCLFVLLGTIVNFLIIYVIFGSLAFIYLLPMEPDDRPRRPIPESRKKRILFVIAHPDDECMFFGPSIVKLIETCEVHLLCLSIGNYREKGSLRKRELYKSCKVLGIPQSNVMIMNSTKMPDDPKVVWNAKQTGRILLDYIEAFSIEEVYTFDIGGVSGHLNHVSIFYGFAYLCLAGQLPAGVKVFLLDSVNKLRKYSFFLDGALSYLPITKRFFVVPMWDYDIIKEAMLQHKTQMVWYRFLYIHLSRYMFINTYKELELEDVQLVLQMSDYNPML